MVFIIINVAKLFFFFVEIMMQFFQESLNRKYKKLHLF